VRLQWAAEQLRQSDQPLASIAHTAGFTDQSHFTRAFRRAFRTTPAAWRSLAHRS
jgi:AraC family transcriptional regulator